MNKICKCLRSEIRVLIVCALIRYGMVAAERLRTKETSSANELIASNVTNCAGSESNAIYVKSFEMIRLGRHNNIANGLVEIRENLPNDMLCEYWNGGFFLKFFHRETFIINWPNLLIVSLHVRHCEDLHDNRTCSTLIEPKRTMSVCQFMRIIDEVISNAFKKARPPFFCPLKKGTYVFDRLPVNNNLQK